MSHYLFSPWQNIIFEDQDDSKRFKADAGEMISETLPLVRHSEISFSESPEVYKFRNAWCQEPPLCGTLLDFVNMKMNFYRCYCNIFTDSVWKESVNFTRLCSEGVCTF